MLGREGILSGEAGVHDMTLHAAGAALALSCLAATGRACDHLVLILDTSLAFRAVCCLFLGPLGRKQAVTVVALELDNAVVGVFVSDLVLAIDLTACEHFLSLRCPHIDISVIL